jgi:membrane protein
VPRLAERLGVVLTVVRTAHEHDVEYPAASLAYYGFVSLFPLLLLVLAVVSESTAAQIRAVMPPFLAPEARRLVSEAAASATSSGRFGATVLAVAVLAWSGAMVAVGVLTVVERVEGGDDRPRSERVRGGVSALGSIGLAALVLVCTIVLLSSLPTSPLVALGALVVPLVALVVAFLPLYYVPSRTVADPTAALPGALTAAVGWTLLLVGIHLYAVNAGRYAIYGVISGIIVVLTSLYLAAFVLLLGFVVNATLAERSRTS